MKGIRTKFFLEKCFAGLNFIALGIWLYSLEQGWDLVWLDFLLGIVIIGYFIFLFIIGPKLHYEPEDEMTRSHERRAQAATYNMVCKLLALLGLLCMLSRHTRNTIFPFE